MLTENFMKKAYSSLEKLSLGEWKPTLLQMYGDSYDFLLFLYTWSNKTDVNATKPIDIEEMLNWLYDDDCTILWTPEKRQKVLQQIRKNSLMSEYVLQISPEQLLKGKKLIRSFLEAVKELIKSKDCDDSDILNLFALGYQIARYRNTLLSIGSLTANSIRTNVRADGGRKSKSRYFLKQVKAEQIYIEFKKERPDLIDMFHKNPKAKKPKTALKLKLYPLFPIEENEKYNPEKTLQNWAKKLFETDGHLA